jgi:hypothetical protein
MSSNGGIPLLMMYLAMIFFVFRAIIVLTKRSESFNPVLFGLIGAWIAYLAQSVISLNQLGLAVWGWVISGLIIGYEFNTRDDDPGSVKEPQPSNGKNAKKKTISKTSTSSLVLSLTFGVIGLLLVLPALVTSNKVSNALSSRLAENIVDSAKAWPRSSAVQTQTAIILSQNNLDRQALEIVNEGILDFPDSYLMWGILSELKSATPAQVEEAKRQMKRLDPLNPNLK